MLLRLLNRFVDRLLPHGTVKSRNEQRNQWSSDFPCCLPVNDYYRPSAILLEDFESLWLQTRGGFQDRQIPRDDIDSSLHDCTRNYGEDSVEGTTALKIGERQKENRPSEGSDSECLRHARTEESQGE